MKLFALLLAALAMYGPGIVREEQTVEVNGVREIWRLVWKPPPKPACAPNDPTWYTCPCAGIAFGESGSIDLVRLRQGREVERLGLDSLFTDDGFPRSGRATVQRAAVGGKDLDDPDSAALPAIVVNRPAVRIMSLADYDHDGHATEFYLQTSTGPCGHTWGRVIGVSTLKPTLHAFGTVLNPDTPLRLGKNEWDVLVKSRAPSRVVDWPCGDHGDNKQTAFLLQATPRGIEVIREVYRCPRTANSRPLKVEQLY